MERDLKGAIALLTLFLIITIATLAYSLPSNVYSPQKGSVTEVSVMDYSDSSHSLTVSSNIYINSPKPTDVVVGIPTGSVKTTKPDAEISENGIEWTGAYSKRSRTYFEGDIHNSLYYEASIPFENPIDVSIETSDGKVNALITNNADIAIENIFINYNIGDQQRRYVSHLSNIDANTNETLELELKHPEQRGFVRAMEDGGISNYAAWAVFNRNMILDSKIYGIEVNPFSYDATYVQIIYKLPEGMHNQLIPLETRPAPTHTYRFAWVVEEIEIQAAEPTSPQPFPEPIEIEIQP